MDGRECKQFSSAKKWLGTTRLLNEIYLQIAHVIAWINKQHYPMNLAWNSYRLKFIYKQYTSGVYRKKDRGVNIPCCWKNCDFAYADRANHANRPTAPTAPKVMPKADVGAVGAVARRSWRSFQILFLSFFSLNKARLNLSASSVYQVSESTCVFLQQDNNNNNQ